MKNVRAITLAVALIATVAQPSELLACAQGEGTGRPMSAKELTKLRKDRARQDAFLAPEVKTLNKTCGTQITAKIEWDTVGYDPSNAANYCTHALDSISRLCVDASGQVDQSGKDAVMKQIKAVSCSHGPKRTLGLKDGTLHFESDFTASDDRSTIVEFLRNNL